MIILNEKEYATSVLSGKEPEPSRLSVFLSIYARCLCQEESLQKTEIIETLHTYMKERHPYYLPVDWAASIEKYADKAGQPPLCQCSGIWVTAGELKTIENLHNKVLERLAFTLLCLAKFKNFKNPDNHNWIHYTNGEIYSMACINASASEKDRKLGLLKQAGLIAYAKKINNLGIQILFLQEESEKQLFVSDFRKLGYEWRLYQGENYIRCAGCGLLVKRKSNSQKYCSLCSENLRRERQKNRMQEKRMLC